SPPPSVTAVFVFSISTGLETSTVTPGSTAPDASLTRPAIALVWATAVRGTRSTHRKAGTTHLTSVRIGSPPRQTVSVPQDVRPGHRPRGHEIGGFCHGTRPDLLKRDEA